MPIRASVTVRGQERWRQALHKLNPEESPEFLRRAFVFGGFRLQSTIRDLLSGPRPRRLDRVTGELVSSVSIDRSGLPWEIAVGIPARLWWYTLHELGLGAQRERPAVREALESEIDRIIDQIEEEWVAQLPPSHT